MRETNDRLDDTQINGKHESLDLLLGTEVALMTILEGDRGTWKESGYYFIVTKLHRDSKYDLY